MLFSFNDREKGERIAYSCNPPRFLKYLDPPMKNVNPEPKMASLDPFT